ncbi:Ribosomal protein L17 [Rickettsiales bacterium Ac37b]|nr:Ribosomal protein L17 [Rickettsiales bacterium Ac37b]
MRHRLKGRKLNRKTAHRNAMFSNMAVSLIKHEQITTTLPKAKDLRPIVEKLVTISRKKDLSTRRYLLKILKNKVAVNKLLEVLAARYINRPGGYLRIIKAGFRFGDMAPKAIIEFVERDIEAKGSFDNPNNSGNNDIEEIE